MDTRFRSAILAREKHRLMLAEEMDRQHGISARYDSIKRIIRMLVIIGVGGFVVQYYFDRAQNLVKLKSQKNTMQMLSQALDEIKTQASNTQKGLITQEEQKVPLPKPLINIAYQSKPYDLPKRGKSNSGYQLANPSQLKMLASRPKRKIEKNKYRPASFQETNRVKRNMRTISSAYARVGTAVPWALSGNRTEFPDIR